VRKINFSNSFRKDPEFLFFHGSVFDRPRNIAEIIFAHCLKDATLRPVFQGRAGFPVPVAFGEHAHSIVFFYDPFPPFHL